MTGVGAIIELFQFFNDGKKKEEEAVPKDEATKKEVLIAAP